MGSNSSSSSLAAAAGVVKSPRHGGGGVDGVGSPQSRRTSTRSLWNQIVRGESEPIAAVPSSPSAAASAVAAVTEPAIPAAAAADSSCSSSSPPPSASSSPSLVEETGGGENSEGGGSGPNGGNVGKRSAWNKPSNGGAAAGEVGPVMGASWPPLSESARPSSAKSSSESLKGLSDGLPSVPASQGSGSTVSTTTTPSQKHAHPALTTNHTGPSRQRSMRRSNSNVSSNGGVPQQQAPAGQAVEIASSNPSPKEHTQRSGFGSHSHGSGDHPQQRNSSRNRTGGPHPRGDGPHHYHHYGGRREQDRGSHDWNSHSRSFNGRDNHLQQPRVSPRMIRGPPPPPSPTHFIPQHLRPYPSMGFPELGPQVFYLAPQPPYVAPPLSPVFMNPPDPQLPSKIVNQIDYYFSNDNLIKDIYLRQNMDDQGWVPIKLIAGFNKVLILTDNIQLILDSVRMSTIVEVQGDKVRRRNDWSRWLVLPSAQFPTISSPQTPGKSSHDMLAARVRGIALEERNPNLSSSGQGSYQPQMPNGDAADRSSSGRN